VRRKLGFELQNGADGDADREDEQDGAYDVFDVYEHSKILTEFQEWPVFGNVSVIPFKQM
jgi:hypothetical protein